MTAPDVDVDAATLARIFDRSPALVALFEGSAHIFALTNRRYQELIGHRDVTGLPLEAVPEAQRLGAATLLTRVFETGEPDVGNEIEVGLHRERGGPVETRYVNVVYAAVRSPAGQVTGVLVIGIDVTDQVLVRRTALEQRRITGAAMQADEPTAGGATDALADSEAQLRTLVDHMPQLAWMADASGWISWYNRQWYAYTGTTPDAMAGWGWQSVHDPGVLPDVLRRWQACIATGAPFDMEFPLRSATGEFRTFLTRVNPLKDGEGRVVRWFGTNTDVEALRKATAALDASEARFRALAESAPVAIVLCAADGMCEYANPAWGRLTGLKPGDALGFGWVLSIHPEDRDRVRSAWASAAERRDVFVEELRYQRPDGAVRYAHVTSQPVVGPDGSVLSIVASIIDFTERREAEEQLRHSQRLQAIGQLAGGMAHELNNVLCASIGMATLALRTIEPALPAARDIQESLKAQERAASITSQVLSFSRRQMLVVSLLDVNRVVTELGPILRQSLHPGLTLRFELSPVVASVRADRAQLEQALLNLVLNARDATPDGGVIVVRTANAAVGVKPDADADATPGRYVRLDVQDPGVGMDEETRRRAVEPFFTTKPVGQGTGLGLSMVYGFARQSGGAVGFDSEPGNGTLVRVYLPVVPESIDHELGETVPIPVGRGEGILLVEDDALVRTAIRRGLEAEGYAVHEASDAGSALALLAKRHADVRLAICDLVMPGMRGEALGVAIAARWPELGILYISGYPRADSDKALAPDGAHFLSKPFRPDVLASRVRAVLDGGPAGF